MRYGRYCNRVLDHSGPTLPPSGESAVPVAHAAAPWWRSSGDIRNCAMPPLRVTVGNAIVCWIIQGQRSLLRGSPPFRSGQPPFLGDGRVPGREVLPPSGEFTVALFCEPHTSAQGNSPFQSCYTHAATPMGWAADGRASQLLLATVGLFLAVFPWACSGEFTAALPPSGESGSPGVRRSGCSCRHSLGLGGGCASVRFPPRTG